jgi:hypothetical protein
LLQLYSHDSQLLIVETKMLNEYTAAVQQPNGFWPRVRDDASRRRSRWDTIPAIAIGYQEFAESSRRLTLAVALLAAMGFVVALTCTGLAMLNHLYGLHVFGVGIAWPASTADRSAVHNSPRNFSSYFQMTVHVFELNKPIRTSNLY